MSKSIIVGRHENSFFFKVVKNLTLQKKYKILFEVSGNSYEELLEKIINSKKEIFEIKLKPTTQFHFGLKRNPNTKKLERCENFGQYQISSLKEIVQNDILNKNTNMKEIFAVSS